VVVIWHEAVVPAFNLALLDDVAEQVPELTVVDIVQEDLHPPVSAGRDVAHETWNL
jgi:hypothetical protein